MFTTICAYLLLIYLFLGVERRLRQGQEAKSWQRGQYDQGSQAVLTIGFGIISIVLVIAPVLNYLRVGQLRPEWLVGGLGLVIMIVGIALRYWAAVTLGEYYTRTLLIKTQHQLIEQGPYRVIRHPGYLGIILAFLGAAFATVNAVAIAAIPVVLAIAYSYRIRTEEKMLQAALGQLYIEYMKRSWRLIPYVY